MSGYLRGSGDFALFRSLRYFFTTLQEPHSLKRSNSDATSHRSVTGAVAELPLELELHDRGAGAALARWRRIELLHVRV